ncbi:BglG family transcription antiterminator [Enterococcus rivorum]|uniref:BglG family transcription antiterminator n=1 Tax=Enterococcus rivorum TaxID=762845 RepID=UPI0009FBBE85|nr:PTS sugar transporter subunit IIA [Enterococcus rivorum]MBP2097728.1 lichenan operon transcriptional antiterminator [Enterococcus rivorum]
MNNINQLLEVFQTHSIVTIQLLKQEFSFSERKIRELIKEAREIGIKKGFDIKTLIHQGYRLEIVDSVTFKEFLDYLNQYEIFDGGNKEYRLSLIRYLLLQNQGFITIDQIAEVLDVSRNTVISDLKIIKKQLLEFDIVLSSKTHYGLTIKGSEAMKRKLFSKMIKEEMELDHNSNQYFEFIQGLKFDEVKKMFIQLLYEYEMRMTENTIESILIHLKILLFRISQKNDISEVSINKNLIDEKSYQLTKKLVRYLERKFKVVIKEQEMDLIASQIYGKATSNQVPKEQEKELKESIEQALVKIDQEFLTDFRHDDLLKECLLLHVYPLLLRISFGLELNNSLINSISVQYTNSFLISIRFIEYHKELSQHSLSRDELGYLALHFAAHQERKNQESIQNIRNILVVSDSRRSKTLLLKVLFENHFPKANVTVRTTQQIEQDLLDGADLVFSTELLDELNKQVVVIMIDETMTEKEMRRIKNMILFQDTAVNNKVPTIQNLFFKDLFFSSDSKDYLDVLETYSQQMVDYGYADSCYPGSVLEREKKFSTIYENGIAGPHSMVQNAKKDSIGVILLKKPIHYEKKEVKCIFLINIRKHHLFLHQEVSQFMMKLMADTGTINMLSQTKTFEEFVIYAKKLW